MMNKPNKREYQRLLTKYLGGKCSGGEQVEVERWYDSFDQDNRNRIDISDRETLLQLKSEMFRNIRQGIDRLERQISGAHLQPPDKRARVIKLRPMKRLAAIILAGIGIVLAVVSQYTFTAERHVDSVAASERPSENRANVRGPATIYLPDGSVVWLDARSWLKYPKAFPAGIREVTLTGEAFFDVAKDSGRPFVIHSTNFTTRVLGTTFKIKDHDDEESQEVEVVTGQVMVSVKTAVSDSVKGLILQSNRKAVYSKKDNSLVESAIKEDVVHTLSSNSKLEFNEVALTDIVKVLNVVHGANITIASEGMKNCIITADLTNETFDVSIAILAKAVNADYTVKGRDVIFSGDGCVVPQ